MRSYSPPDIHNHPELEWRVLCLYRLECDDAAGIEVCTPELVRVVKGKVERLFTTYASAQEIHQRDEYERFERKLDELWLTEVVSPLISDQKEAFLWFPHFVSLDDLDGPSEVIRNWVEYDGVMSLGWRMSASDWWRMLRDKGINILRYEVDEKTLATFSEDWFR